MSPGLKSDIAVDITISDQIVEMNGIGILLALGGTNDHGVISCRIPGKTADRDHRIEHRHIGAIRKCAGLRGFADDADLVGDRTDKAFHDDRNQRLFHILCELLLVFAREGVGVLPIATTSSTSGIERRPSGRTGTVTVSSGLRQTKMFRLSPGPIRYSADGKRRSRWCRR